jgi:hypothetical protein
MRTVIVACAIAAFWPTAATAQVHRIYMSALGGIDAGARGPISGGSLPTIGATAGLRFSEGWSLEAEIERGFRTQERSDEGLWLSRAPSTATREEIERAGVYARFDRSERTGLGWAAVAVLPHDRPAVSTAPSSGASARDDSPSGQGEPSHP